MKPLDVLLIIISLLFATGVIVDHTWGPERRQHRSVVRFQQSQLDLIASRLREFNEKTGRYPTTEEGIEVVPGLRQALLAAEFAPAVRFLERSPGIRTIQGIPFLYENRRDVPAEAFDASPVARDRSARRRFSREVDQGIYLSSLGLRHDLGRVFGRAWLDALLLFSGGVIVFLAIAYIVARNRRSGDRVRGINAMIMVGIAVLLVISFGITGGGLPHRQALPAALGTWRTDLLQDYLVILRGFAARGAISKEAGTRIEATLVQEFRTAGALLLDEPTPAVEGTGDEEGG